MRRKALKILAHVFGDAAAYDKLSCGNCHFVRPSTVLTALLGL
jgi:hypothetical protein